jgi:hypothetical protein
MNFDRVLNGLMKYMDREIFSSMNDWQEMLGRIAVSRLIGNSEQLKNTIMSNAYVRTFAIVDENGNVDVDGLYRDLKEQIRAKDKVEISLPMFGTFRFTESDVDRLYATIKDE